jgi:hypothetical protein
MCTNCAQCVVEAKTPDYRFLYANVTSAAVSGLRGR